MRKPILVVLAHYPDIFSEFRRRVDQWEPDIRKILICDGEMIDPMEVLTTGLPWSIVDGDLPFQYSRNVNLGWRVTGNADVILCGDDIRFDSPFVDALQKAAYGDPTVGVATVQLHGHSPFVAGYWKREVLDKIGYMDERFTGYGYDDNDYCKRMEIAGYHTLCVDIPASHGGGSTFYRKQRETGGKSVQESCDEMKKLFDEKWGV
jgi:hypothetical protein